MLLCARCAEMDPGHLLWQGIRWPRSNAVGDLVYHVAAKDERAPDGPDTRARWSARATIIGT
jgi:sugar phosphate isomerase/epimerase